MELGSRSMFRYYLEYGLKCYKNETKNFTAVQTRLFISISANSLVGPE